MAILSFAHLKSKGQAAPSPAAPSRTLAPVIPLQRLAGIGVMKSARLAAVNYCAPCPRFWPADESEKKAGIPYGRCCRVSGWVESWRNIPLTAKVSRCWYHQQEDRQDENTYGRHACQEARGDWQLELDGQAVVHH